jgi:hypothetical protein
MVDIAYVLLFVAVFLALAFMLRGLERLQGTDYHREADR